MKEILKKAQNGRYAIGSFNFSTAEVLKAIVEAAKELKAPVIVSTSKKEADFFGRRGAAALVKSWREATKIPLILNLDHGKDFEDIKKAIAAGYDMIHFDGSELSFQENLWQTKEVVDYARQVSSTFDREIIVEGELGYLRGASSLQEKKLEIKPEDLTKPDEAREFVEKTGVDSLAMAIGNAHGVFKISEEKLDLQRLAEIKKATGEKVFLVLHGGSGIPAQDIKKAIELGIVKINVNTDLRLAYSQALIDQLKDQPKETTPYKILEPVLESVKKVVEEKIKLFGSENKI